MDRAETLSDAAAELGVSSSALSQALTELERRVGLPLFERRGRARSLSSRGREMVVHAERILGATRDLTLWAQQSADGKRGAIRLGLIDIAAVAYFPDALLRFRAERPDVELHLTVAGSASLVEQLTDGRLDLAVLVDPASDAMGDRAADSDRDTDKDTDTDTDTGTDRGDGTNHGDTDGDARRLDGNNELEAIELLVEELAVYGPPGRTGGRVPPASWGPWVTFPPGSHTRRLIAAAVRSLGAEFRVEAESHQPEVLRQLVHLGLGWTVLPVLQAEAEPHPLTRARTTPLVRRRLVVARRRSTPIDPVGAELVERLRLAGLSVGT
jgi:DNA-binding transcriptional LysR family regulator